MNDEELSFHPSVMGTESIKNFEIMEIAVLEFLLWFIRSNEQTMKLRAIKNNGSESITSSSDIPES